MKIADVLTRDAIIKSLQATTKRDVLKEISETVAGLSPSLNAETLFKMLMEREELCSTALDHGVAVPHLRMHGLSEPVAAFARSEQGVDFGSLDGKPTHLFMTIIASESRADEYISLLAGVTSVLKDGGMRERLEKAESTKDIFETLVGEL
ncbi:MAG: PTS sugar transporter subunit IIA [Thermodesulfobacteriota bacterium]